MKIIAKNDENAVEIAVDFLKKGAIISFATDTVYGLAVDASSFDAIEALYNLKKRQRTKPIAIFLPDLKTAKNILNFDEVSTKIAEKFLPGALTLVLRKSQNASIELASNLNENDDFLGFRIVKDDFIENVLAKFSKPIAVTSANISGEKEIVFAADIERYFIDKKPDLLIDGGFCKMKVSSTIVKIDNKNLTILREGAISSSLINQD